MITARSVQECISFRTVAMDCTECQGGESRHRSAARVPICALKQHHCRQCEPARASGSSRWVNPAAPGRNTHRAIRSLFSLPGFRARLTLQCGCSSIASTPPPPVGVSGVSSRTPSAGSHRIGQPHPAERQHPHPPTVTGSHRVRHPRLYGDELRGRHAGDQCRTSSGDDQDRSYR